MKTLRLVSALMFLCLLFPCLSLADEPVYPEYVQNAQSMVEKASSRASELSSFTDEVLIARNFIRNAESEYKKNLSWTGKLDMKAEPTVRYYAAMAQLQAAIVLSRVGKVAQEQERASLEAQTSETKARIKVFDDKKAEIATLTAKIAELEKTVADLKLEKQQLMTAGEQKSRELNQSLEQSRGENKRLQGELTALAAAKGAEVSQNQEQIRALNRQKDFAAEVGKLGGVIKPGTDNMTVIFSRSALLKAPKNVALTTDGNKALDRVVALLKSYPEYRAKIKVHGFGSPARSEDATATDRMARLIRETLVTKGNFEPALIEALGVGTAEPVYPKNNSEGNRRVEITFVLK